MYKREKDLKVAVLPEFRGGTGETKMIHFISQVPAAEAVGRLFAKTVLAPGCSIGQHAHQGDFEIYYILKGEATIQDQDEQVVLRAGDVHLCEDGHRHAIRNSGTQDLEYIALILYSR